MNGPVPGDEDIVEEEESEDSLTIHSARYRKLSLLSISADASGIAIAEADSEDRYTDQDPDDETERVKG